MSAMGVKRAGFVTSTVCPVDPKQQTFPDSVDTSHLGQQRKFACFPLDYDDNSFSSASASLRSRVSNPSVNQP